MAIKALLNGYKGRMGQAILAASENSKVEICAQTDIGDDTEACLKGAEVIIDFSHKDATLPLVEIAARRKIPVVIGTTGHTPEERAKIIRYTTQIPIVWSGNYSIGMNLLFYLTKRSAETLPELYEPEITEVHHHFKVDAPSGTAVDLARRICEGRDWDYEESIVHGREGMTGERKPREIGMHALRGGDIVGDHRVSFFGEGERVELRHIATDRKIFAQGALTSALWVVKQAPGLYEMQDVMGLR